MFKLRKNQILLIIIEVFSCFLVVEKCGLDLQMATKVVLYVLSFYTGINSDKILEYYKSSVNGNKNKVGLLLVVVYAAFAMVGNRLFIYPLDKSMDLESVLLYAITVVWFLPIIILFLYYYERIELKKKSRNKTIRFCIITGLLLIVPACLALYAYNPGISSPDSVACLLDFAHNIQGMKNWHPPFYVMLLKVIISIWDSTYAVIIVQIVFWLYVMLEGLLFLRARGISEKVLILFAAFMGINPANYLHLCTIWKDIPYSVSLLWFTVIIAKLLVNKVNNEKWCTYIEYIICTVFVFFLRQNGMVVYLIMVPVLVIFFRKNKRLIVSTVVSILLILVVRFPIYSYINVQEADGGIYIGLSQDILGVYYAGGEVSEDTIEMIDILTKHNKEEFEYDPYYAKSSYDLDVKMTTFIENYLDTFIHNPVIMTREIILRQDCVWDVFGGEDARLEGVNYRSQIGSINEEWANYYGSRIDNKVMTLFELYQYHILNNQVTKVLVWQTGIYTLFCIIAIYVVLKGKDKKNVMVFGAFLTHIISLVLSTGWSDFRYYWPLNIIAVFIILFVPTLERE